MSGRRLAIVFHDLFSRTEMTNLTNVYACLRFSNVASTLPADGDKTLFKRSHGQQVSAHGGVPFACAPR